MAGYYSNSNDNPKQADEQEALAGLDDIERLEAGFEQVQRLHSEELRALHETDGKLLDKRIYIAKRKAITDATEL